MAGNLAAKSSGVALRGPLDRDAVRPQRSNNWNVALSHRSISLASNAPSPPRGGAFTSTISRSGPAGEPPPSRSGAHTYTVGSGGSSPRPNAANSPA